MRGFVIALLVCLAMAVPADPGYHLGEPRTNAVGLGAAAAFGSNGELFVVGGSGVETVGLGPAGSESFVFRDNRLFTIASRTWSSLQPLPLGQQRAFHSLSVLDAAASRVAVFGGSRDGLFLNDIWIYTRATNVWTPVVPVSGPVPPGRAGHATKMIGQTLWVFGGLSSGGVLLNDAWAFSFASLTWRQALASNPPTPRYLHVAFASGPTTVCLFGGSESPNASPLGVAASSSSSISCLNTALPDGAYTIESPTGATSVVAASVADNGVEAVVFGGVSGGAVSQRVQVFSLGARTWSTIPASNVRAYAAGALSSAGLMWQFGGLDASNRLGTFVLATGPSPSWAAVSVSCEAAFSGAQCVTPVCRNNCWGVGRCIAPDLCECSFGFTGALCSQQLCTTCGIGLLPLNQPIYWPRAQNKATNCIDSLSDTIRQILALLPASPETCAEKNTLSSPLNLTAVSKAAWDFRIGASKALVDATIQTLQLLKL